MTVLNLAQALNSALDSALADALFVMQALGSHPLLAAQATGHCAGLLPRV